MRVAIVSFTAKGAQLARTIQNALQYETVMVFARAEDAQNDELSLSVPIRDWAAERFADSDALIFVGAVGIAVRAIAQSIAAKEKDPAVVVLDEAGAFAIPILSGHLGGANALARRIADAIGSQAVITTATDVNQVFSVDDWARKNGWIVENVPMIKAVSGALLSGKSVALAADAPIAGTAEGIERADAGELGIFVSPRLAKPFNRTLLLRPRVLTLGVGCKRGTSAEQIADAADSFLKNAGYSPLSLFAVATVDLKADEIGLLTFCKQRRLAFFAHGAQELSAVPGSFSASEFVRTVAGVDNVCERAAALHGTLIVQKTTAPGIALALSQMDWEVRL